MPSGYLDRLLPQPTMPNSEAAGARKRSLPFKAPRPVGKSTASTAPTTSKAGAAAKKQKTTQVINSKQAKAAQGINGNYKARTKAVVISDEEDELDDVEEDDNEEEEARAGRGRRVDRDSEDEDVSMNDESEDEPAPARKPAKAAPKTVTKATTAKRKPSALDEPQPIPPKLLTRLLYEGFEDKDMKISKDAMAVVGKYVETFVKEALARAVYERTQADGVDGGIGGGIDGDFLQVEDLEKLAPQLLLDF